MKCGIRTLGTLVSLIVMFNTAWGITSEEILSEVDKLQTLKADATAKVAVIQTKPKETPRIIKMHWYRRDEDNAFLIVMLEPAAEWGNGFLRTSKDFVMYRRQSRAFQRINGTLAIGDSAARTGNFEKKKLSELYEPIRDRRSKDKLREGMLDTIPVYYLELRAKTRAAEYPKMALWVRKDNYLPLKDQGFSSSGQLLTTSYYLRYQKVGATYIMVKGIFIDEFEKGNRTILEISDIVTRTLNSSIFTKEYLKAVSR